MADATDPVYERGYHSRRHGHLISDEAYFWARSEGSARFYFTREERGKRIFEYGCGIGQGIASLPAAAGWDISGEAREVCRRRGVTIFDRFEEVPRRSWDIAFCRHVLEHVENPLDVLRALGALLANDREANLYLVLPKESHHRSGLEPDLNQHLYCWNFRTANNLLWRSGLEPYYNGVRYCLGFRALLPVRRIFGPALYLSGVRAVGWLKRNGELIIRARPMAAAQ